MKRSDVLTLSQVTAEPAVSILMPVQRAAVSHDADRLRLRHLVDGACDEVARTYAGPEAMRVVGRLREMVDEVDLDHPGDGIAAFVRADGGQVFDLPFPVQEQVSVERVFATRQVLVGLARRPRVRVLVLGGHQIRLFDDRDGRLVEVRHGGFPLVRARAHQGEAPDHGLKVREQVKEEEHRSAYRAADAALDAVGALGPVPIIVLGAERELAYFDEVSHHGDLVVGRVPGSYAHAGAAALDAAVRPAIDAYLRDRDRQVADELRVAIDDGRAATDLRTVWEAATEGRGHRLVVEDGFSPPPAVDDLAAAPWARPDAVDELIARVLVARGEVTFVAAGALAPTSGIGLVLRY